MSLRGKSIFIGSLSFFCFALLRYFIPLRNMGFFVAACIVFVLAAVLFYIISGRRKEGYSDRAERIWCVLPVVALTVWLILFYINETNTAEALDAAELIRRTFPFPLWITLMLAGTAVCLFLLKKSSTEKVCTGSNYGFVYDWYISSILCTEYFSGRPGRNISQPCIYQQYHKCMLAYTI